jgi:LmbE family N-acetylglucosaminyl deacetylase
MGMVCRGGKMSDQDGVPILPDLLQAKRVLCIQPHYDDNDLSAGGTISRLHDSGTRIMYLTVTDDLVGVVDPSLSDEEAGALLRKEQLEAGAIIGVDEQYWLGYPDAGQYSHYELRQRIIQYMRMLRPDFVFTVDPWLPYEAHQDHIRTGLAVAEAVYLQRYVRLSVDDKSDRDYQPYDISAIVFYDTNQPNVFSDISTYKDRKHQAVDHYKTQFTPQATARLHEQLDDLAREWAVEKDHFYAEALKIVTPAQLHGGGTVRMLLARREPVLI